MTARRVQPLRPEQGLHVHRADPPDEAGLLRPASATRRARCVALSRSRSSFPASLLASPPRTVQAEDIYYNNKIMNFYGDSFHVTAPGYSYTWTLRRGRTRIAGRDARAHQSPSCSKDYEPLAGQAGHVQTPATCQLVRPAPTAKPWPTTATTSTARPSTRRSTSGAGRLHAAQRQAPGQPERDRGDPEPGDPRLPRRPECRLGDAIAGEIIWNAGSRDGVDGTVQKDCRTKSLTDCYIGRFGWLGDRVSLEDQVANAAFVEMNMTTTEGYNEALRRNDKITFPIRYAHPNCGPANKTCVESKGNRT